MNRELRQLLEQAGCLRPGDERGASRLIVAGNRGAVPAPEDLPAESARRGFNVLVIDRHGRPSHFVRCAARDDASLMLENRILEALASDAQCARAIPAVRCLESEHLRIQVTTYVQGPSYASIFPYRSPEQWTADAAAIIQVSEQVTGRAEVLLPDLVMGGDAVCLAEEAAQKFEVLAGAGAPAQYLAALRAALEPLPAVPRRLQHGDLWPANVLHHDESWWLIDFAEFGQAQVPMYDVFVFLHQTWTMRNLEAARPRWEAASRDIVRASAARLGLSASQVAGGLIYYLVHLSAYRLRHGVRYRDRATFFRQLLQMAEWLREGAALEQLPFPWERSQQPSGS